MAVFTSAEEVVVAEENDTLDGAAVLPGWKVSLARLWAELDRQAPAEG